MANEIPKGLCQCGCGQATKIAKKTDVRNDQRKGEPRRYIKGHHVQRVAKTFPPRLCACGCGQPTRPAPQGSTRAGLQKGEPARYAKGHNARTAQRPRNDPGWTREWHITQDGYVRVHRPDHPAANKFGYVYEHRLVMEEALGRYLQPGEVVHHKNGDRHDNRPKNLQLVPTLSAHMLLHGKNGRWAKAHDRCVNCGTTKRSHMARGMCSQCYFRWAKGRL